MRAISTTKLAAVLTALLGMFSVAKADEPKVVEQKLESEYTLTTVNAEGAVVTQGVVLTLKKGGLSASSVSPLTNEYKDGNIALTKGSTARKVFGVPSLRTIVGNAGTSAQAADQTARPFVAGEKMYVTKFEVKDGMVLTLISDPISDVRYKAELKFPLPKGASLDLAQADRLIAEVFKVAPPPAPDAAAPAQVGATAAAPAAQPLAAIPAPEPPPPAVDPAATTPIAPPPPPPDQPAAPPATLSLGLTIDQVVAILGQPATVADLGTKKIYTYKSPNMKVTFVNGKVTDMQ
jgi:hypothetical protein